MTIDESIKEAIKEAFNAGRKQGYNNAIDDFLEVIDRADREDPLVLDIFVIEQIAEQLKSGGKYES